MAKPILKYQELLSTTIFLVALFITSQTSDSSCILDVQLPSAINNSNCAPGNWGGFISNACCVPVFDEYLYASGQMAERTGQVYLNSTEQEACLISMKPVYNDVLGCGIQKLTGGSGGCSSYTKADVVTKLGNMLNDLAEDCRLIYLDDEHDQACNSCLKKWEEIGGSSNNGSDLNSEGNEQAGMGGSTYTKQSTGSYVSYSEESSDLKISPREIYLATGNLNEVNLIGQGIAGKVYRGMLSNGKDVAVKHIIDDGYAETFVREVTSLSHIRHPNLVALLGFCQHKDDCFLVYELCHNGNLSEWLYGKDKFLSWIQRLEIAINSARGLWFLHTYPEGCIVHRDIKPTNILIDAEFQAKLSDFGLSKVMDVGQSYVSSEVRGTFGYVDPEYRTNHRVNAKGDVYSFGIVLLQLISGQRVINLNLHRPVQLNKMAKFLSKGGNITEFADPKLNGDYSVKAFDLVLKLALSCTGVKQERPSMEQVVLRLEEALDISMRMKSIT
ncbi:serine-threonine protein kinase, plant-type, putative [Ricinus communis]|uniref:Serine-threonine protein kinase, plant-type, putative n=1 Tax=Ricinus communis TaxID=3988 RepID=B9SH77_RICCO|nr:serine-threonine protein kinase, plant-type, putative [Ricinus communis]